MIMSTQGPAKNKSKTPASSTPSTASNSSTPSTSSTPTLSPTPPTKSRASNLKSLLPSTKPSPDTSKQPTENSLTSQLQNLLSSSTEKSQETKKEKQEKDGNSFDMVMKDNYVDKPAHLKTHTSTSTSAKKKKHCRDIVTDQENPTLSEVTDMRKSASEEKKEKDKEKVENKKTVEKQELLTDALSTLQIDDYMSTEKHYNFKEEENKEHQLTPAERLSMLVSMSKTDAAKDMLGAQPIAHRLTVIEAIRQKPPKWYEDTNTDKQRPTSEEERLRDEIAAQEREKAAQAMNKEQLRNLSTYDTQKYKFDIKEVAIQKYIKSIRCALLRHKVDITPKSVLLVINSWKEQYELHLEVSSGRTVPKQDDGSSSEKKSDFPIPEKSGTIGAFLSHCTVQPPCASKSLKPTKASKSTFSILVAITDEVLNLKEKDKLPIEEFNLNIQVANARWNAHHQAQHARLTSNYNDMDQTVKRWQTITPNMLNDDETNRLRDPKGDYFPFFSGEDAEHRKNRKNAVPGFLPRLEQIKADSICTDESKELKKRGHKKEKQHCELNEDERVSMQEVGIHPKSYSRQSSFFSKQLLGIPTWENEFKGERLDPDMAKLFPERKAETTKILFHQYNRRCAIESKLTNGVFKKSTKEPKGGIKFPEVANISQEDAEDVADKLRKYCQ